MHKALQQVANENCCIGAVHAAMQPPSDTASAEDCEPSVIIQGLMIGAYLLSSSANAAWLTLHRGACICKNGISGMYNAASHGQTHSKGAEEMHRKRVSLTLRKYTQTLTRIPNRVVITAVGYCSVWFGHDIESK